MTNKPYKVRYRVETGEFSKEDAGPEDGLTHALLLVSCLFPPDGSYSQLLLSLDGRTNDDMTTHDIFKAWILLAPTLLRREDELTPLQKQILTDAFEVWRQHILNSRD